METMDAIVGAILVLAASVLVHAATSDHRGYDGFALWMGILIGFFGLTIVVKSIFFRRVE